MKTRRQRQGQLAEQQETGRIAQRVEQKDSLESARGIAAERTERESDGLLSLQQQVGNRSVRRMPFQRSGDGASTRTRIE
jgi:hypothetical protein